MSGSEETTTEQSPLGLVDSSRGWQVVGATFLSTFTVFGVSYSFGAFFDSMAAEFGTNLSVTSLFFSITVFLYFGLGIITGRIADRIGPRTVLLGGAAVMSLGLLATSRVDSIWLGFLTYGVGVGIGVACAYVPMVATVGAWFETKRTTALGVAVAGIGIGTLVVAPIAEALVEQHGWRTTYVVFGIATAVLLSIASLGAHRPPGHAAGSVATPTPLRESIGRSRPFWIQYSATVVMTVALFVPFVFMARYISEKEIDGSAGLIVGLIGLASVVGRLGLGALAARFDVFFLYVGSFFVLGSSFLIWFAAGESYTLLVVFAITLGVAYGGFIALSPAVAAHMFGTDGLGGILGALYTGAGIGGLIGPPLMGALIASIGFQPTILVALAFGIVAAIILLPLRTNAGGTP